MSFSILPIVITGVGAYMIYKVMPPLFSHPLRALKILYNALENKENRRSLLLALGGTLGVGNIFGVSLGLILGGAGSVFWMLVSSLFSSALKYSEVAISASYNKGEGIIYAIRARLPRLFSVIYTILIIGLALGMGAALQSRTLVDSVGEIFDTPPYISAALVTLAVLVGIVFGSAIIPKITEFLIPLSTIVYILLSLAVILVCSSDISRVLFAILCDAFTPTAATGGVFAFLFSRGITEGYSRGIMSNEAGSGTSTLAHASSTASPVAKGMQGILEVIFDTAVLCPLTGLAVLLSIPDLTAYSSPMSLVCDAFSLTLGAWSLAPLLISIFIFGYSTVISWYYYFDRALCYLFGSRSRFAPLVYLLAVLFGSMTSALHLTYLVDVILLLLTLITSLTLIKSSDRLRCLSETELLYKSDSR